MKNKKSGFTLIELLVVIAIVAILSAIVMVSLNSSRGKARNARVLSQVDEYVKAIELYRADNNGALPTPTGTIFNEDNHRMVCLGSGPCTSPFTNEAITEDSSMTNGTTGLAKYISGAPSVMPNSIFFETANKDVTGAVYRCTDVSSSNKCVSADIGWYTEGTSCPSNATVKLGGPTNFFCVRTIGNVTGFWD